MDAIFQLQSKQNLNLSLTSFLLKVFFCQIAIVFEPILRFDKKSHYAFSPNCSKAFDKKVFSVKLHIQLVTPDYFFSNIEV